MASCPCLHPTTALQTGCSSLQQRWRCSDSQVWPRNQESMHAGRRFRGKPCIDSQVWPRNQESMQPLGSCGLQAKPFFFAATENRIGCGPRRCCYDHCRRNHSSLQQQKLESDAEDRCRDDCCRRNHFPLRQRRIESDADIVAVTAVAGGNILLCGNEN